MQIKNNLTEQELQINKNRLDNLINDLGNNIKVLKDLQWKIIRQKKEIESICNDLGYEFIDENK